MKTIKIILLALTALLLMSCSTDDMPTGEPPVVVIPEPENPQPEQPEPEIPVDQNRTPDWLMGCWLSEYGSADGSEKMICFEETSAFLDLTFTDQDGNWVAPYQPITYDLVNPHDEFGVLSNYRVFHENDTDYVTFDFVDIFYPERTLNVTITKVRTDDGSRKVDVKLYDGIQTYFYGKFLPYE